MIADDHGRPDLARPGTTSRKQEATGQNGEKRARATHDPHHRTYLLTNHREEYNSLGPAAGRNRAYGRQMDYWLSIEVLDGERPASEWRRAHGDDLTEAAVTNGARQWRWHEHSWGVVIELEFTSDEQRDRFRRLPAVRAALDAVPDPANGLLVYPGRGGGSGSRIPRRPRPLPMSGAGALPEPHEDQSIRLAAAIPAVISAAC
jgi:hypothetical protein